ncbi:hypothetical protein [Streptomyces murinus]|uniref:CBS domain-containing protein n=1 Tax=Streptomyces murinus TaxID=33900 RepID=A0A7W3NSP7_STRMR|nr:hypothetical protein [Streptomyces murinus]MBA9056005.1 hypothetical protein [Streptomyces murinus]UWW90526.1 hypothetical protein GO605_06385 [Streptomyces murinus]
MHATGRKACLANAISTEYEIVNASAHLLPVLPAIRAHEFVLVRAADGRVSGIVTSADLAGEFGTVARPFFTLGDIERRLRRCLGRVYDEADVQKMHKKKTSVDEMMFGELRPPPGQRGTLGQTRLAPRRQSPLHRAARPREGRPQHSHALQRAVTQGRTTPPARQLRLQLRLYDPDYGAIGMGSTT